MENTLIEWTRARVPVAGLKPAQLAKLLRSGAELAGEFLVLPGFTFNPWIGCTKVSPGCKFCYAAWRMDYRLHRVEWGKGKPRIRTSPAYWEKVRRWDRQARESGVRLRVFCASLADWLDEEIDVLWRRDLLELIHDTQNLDWLLLTKRPENFRQLIAQVAAECTGNGSLLAAGWVGGHPDNIPANVWIGTTTEDQPRMMERHGNLMAIPARVHFWSAEPMISMIDAREMWLKFGAPDWVIAGGESGADVRNAQGEVIDAIRPMHPAWPRALRDLSAEDGWDVDYFFKQWGEWVEVAVSEATHWVWPSGLHKPLAAANPDSAMREGAVPIARRGKKAAGRLLDGREHNAAPTPMAAAA